MNDAGASLVAAATALDAALVAAFLLFYAQAVSRYGYGVGASVWRSRGTITSAVAALVLTIASLVNWGAPGKAPLGDSNWFGPGVVGLLLATGLLHVLSLLRAVSVGSVTDRYCRSLRRRHFLWMVDPTARRAALHGEVNALFRVPEDRPLWAALATDTHNGSETRVRAVSLRRLAAWICRPLFHGFVGLATTSGGAPVVAVPDFARHCINAGDAASLRQMSLGLSTNKHIVKNVPTGAVDAIAQDVTAALEDAPPDLSRSVATAALQLLASSQEMIDGSSLGFRTTDAHESLVRLARRWIARSGLIAAIIETISSSATPLNLAVSRDTLQNIGIALIDRGPIRDDMYGSQLDRDPDPFGYLVDTICELGSDEDPDAWMQRICGLEVIVAHLPGNRSDRDVEYVAWKLGMLSQACARSRSHSTRRAIYVVSLFLDRYSTHLGDEGAETLAEHLTAAGALVIDDPELDASDGLHSDDNWPPTLSGAICCQLARLPAEAVLRGAIEAGITQAVPSSQRLRLLGRLQRGVDDKLGFRTWLDERDDSDESPSPPESDERDG